MIKFINISKFRSIYLFSGVISGALLSFLIAWNFFRKPKQRRNLNIYCSDPATSNCSKFIFLIHGGAGVISKTIDGAPYYESLSRVTRDILAYINANRGSKLTALDIVEYGVILLEDDPLFNAGRGAVFTSEQTHELEASIMDGSNLQAGAASLIKTVKNPIILARAIMDPAIPHTFLVGQAAEAIAGQFGLERVEENYFSTEYRLEQLQSARARKKVVNDHDLLQGKSADGSTGTVGCVCMYDGHVAAASSSGGLTNKYPGRIGHTPIIGAGVYADDRSCAVSSTGRGEPIMAHVAAYDISTRMRIGGQPLVDAVKHTVHEHLPTGTCGVIAVDGFGNYAMEFNTSGMFRAMCNSEGECCMGIWHETISVSV